MKNYYKAFFTIYFLIGLVWLRSSLEKIIGGQFINSLGKILSGVAQKNPYPWYKDFLQSVAIPNSQTLAMLTMYGEFLTSISIIFGSIHLLFSKTKNETTYYLLILGLIGGMFLNLNFWLGFGYTSPSTDSLNLLMFFIELIGVISLLSSRQQHN